MKLSEYIRDHHAPTFWYGRLKYGTIEDYVDSVKYFFKIVGDLPLEEITATNGSRFVLGLNGFGLANETVRKHCRNLNSVFSKMGPKGPRNREAFGFLTEPPWIKPPEGFLKLPREVFDVQVDKLFESCQETWSCYVYPGYLGLALRPRWWETLILFIVTTALRRGAVLNLTWDDVDLDRACVVIPSRIDKCRRERIKPLHPTVLEGFRAIQGGDHRLLPWQHGAKRFYKIWHEMNEQAGLEPHLKVHDLKRYALQKACRSGVDAATLQMLGDHSSLQTTLDYYVRENFAQYVSEMELPGLRRAG